MAGRGVGVGDGMRTVDEVGVVAALAQFHHRIHEVWNVARRRAFTQVGEVALENGAVVLLLDVRQLHLDDRLFLWSNRLLNILLQTPKHHRLQDLQKNTTYFNLKPSTLIGGYGLCMFRRS